MFQPVLGDLDEIVEEPVPGFLDETLELSILLLIDHLRKKTSLTAPETGLIYYHESRIAPYQRSPRKEGLISHEINMMTVGTLP
jgi:hypothetical protein